jgi:hypothetical protein
LNLLVSLALVLVAKQARAASQLVVVQRGQSRSVVP